MPENLDDIVEIFSFNSDSAERIQSKCFQCDNSNLTSFDFELNGNKCINDRPQSDNEPAPNGATYCGWKIRDGRVKKD